MTTPANGSRDDPAPLPFAATIPVAGLTRDGPTPVTRALDAQEAAALARFLGIVSVESLAFEGTVAPAGADGWVLGGRLSGAVVQSCVVTLEPVRETIAAEIERRYRPPEPGDRAETVEIGPDDLDAPEPLAGDIDLAAVIVEALALALAPYPRLEGVEFRGHVHAGPGVTPLTDEAARPFAALAGLRDRLGRDGNE